MKKDSPYFNLSKNLLKETLLFKQMDNELFEEALSHLFPLCLPKKTIIEPYQTQKYIFIIVKGRVKVSQTNHEGREYIISLLATGDLFDIITFLDEKQHEVIVETIDETVLLKTNIEFAKKWLEIHPEVYKNLLTYLAKQMRELEENAVNLSLYDTMTRLSKLILKNTDNDGINVKNIDDLSHETIAKMIGSVRKVVNLNIQKLKREEVINYSNRKLTIKNLKKLIKIAEF